MVGECAKFRRQHQEADQAARGYVPAAAVWNACEDGQGGREGRCVGHDPQSKRDVVVRLCGADEILPIGG